MAKRVVVLGGGSAGSMVANRLAKSMQQEVNSGDLEIIMICNKQKHIYQPGFLYLSFNEGRMEQFSRDQKGLLHPKIRFVQDEATRIDPDNNTVITTQHSISYDILVIATGSFLNMDSVPGLAESAHDFYTPEGAAKLRDALLEFQGGTILMTIDVPHKCPVASLEWMFMADEMFRDLGIRDNVMLKYTYPIGRIHSLEPVAKWAASEFEKRGIETEVFFNLEKVDPLTKEAYNMDGTAHPFDMLVSIPAHQGARVVRDSGLGDEDGFIPTDRYSLRMQGRDNIFVLGDATNLPVSKAGSTAHYQAEVVVKNIVSDVQGIRASHRYDGKAFCFIEAGLSEATYIWFDYKTPPRPMPPTELLHWFKLSYNELYWLSARGMM